MKKPRLTTIFSMILIFAGISLALYPTISNILAQKHASQAITEYNDEIKDMDEEKIDAVKEAMQQYNEQLGNAVTQDAIGEQQTGTSHVDRPLATCLIAEQRSFLLPAEAIRSALSPPSPVLDLPCRWFIAIASVSCAS